MAYVKVPAPSVVYHLAKADRLDSILDDGQIRRFEDSECWFCESLPKMKAYMEQTVMCDGKPYYAVGGQLCRYPKFVPEDYVLLKLAPCQPKDNWYRWDQEVPPGSPKELIKAAKEFSALKIGYRGDLWFSTVETIDVPAFLHGEIISQKQLTSGEAWSALFNKTENEMAGYMNRLDQLSRDELIQAADEISTMMTCHSELMAFGENLSRKKMIFLLQQEKPLELLSEAWMEHQTVDVGETFQSLLTGLYDETRQTQVRDMVYAIQPKTIEELLTSYPDDYFQLMTPCGFVDLTPSETEKLLHGEATMAHPGVSGCQMPVEAQELLEMEVLSLKRDEHGCWYALTDHPQQKMEQAPQEPQML